MNNTRQIRLVYVIVLVVVLIAASILLVFGLAANTKSFRVPTEVNAGDYPEGEVFKVGGFVVDNSIRYTSGSTTIKFIVTDATEDTPEGETLEISYTGLLPSLFREGQWTVTEGEYSNGVFNATHIMAKHDEDYVSPSATDEKLQARIDRARALREAVRDAANNQ